MKNEPTTLLNAIVDKALSGGEDVLALGNRLNKRGKWNAFQIKNAINEWQWNHAKNGDPGTLVRGARRGDIMLGEEDYDILFGDNESSGAAYDRDVETNGDDSLGAGAWRATAAAPVVNIVARPAAMAAPPPPASSPPLSTPVATSWAPSSSTINPVSLAVNRALEGTLYPTAITATPIATPTPSSSNRHHHKRKKHHHNEDGGGRYGNRGSQYGQQSATNTSWPPPRPANLIPGAPWPPPGAVPGSDLSSFYPPGSPQANSYYWGAQPAQGYPPASPYGSPYGSSPYGSPYGDPYGSYSESPGYTSLGLAFDEQGRAEIVDVPRPRAPRAPRAASMGAAELKKADHKFDVIALRAKLRRIGMNVSKNGSVDQPLTDAVNGIFKGWDDAPAGLRAGDMTPNGLQTHIKLVNKLVDKAVGGAQHLENAERD